MRQLFKNFLYVFLVLLLVAGVLGMLKVGDTKKPEVIDISKLVTENNAGAVQKVVVAGDIVQVTLKDPAAKAQEVKKEPTESFGELLKNYGATDEARKNLAIEIKDESSWKFWVSNLVPALLPLIIIMVFLYFMTRSVQG